MQAPFRPKVGVVLSGGGSRGAYEAGIIHYIRTDLAKRMGRQPPIDIVTGTSVGAINAALLASLAHRPVAEQVDHAIALWLEMRKQDVIARIVGHGGVRTLVRLVGHAPADAYRVERCTSGRPSGATMASSSSRL